jgi:hypothetical protein
VEAFKRKRKGEGRLAKEGRAQAITACVLGGGEQREGSGKRAESDDEAFTALREEAQVGRERRVKFLALSTARLGAGQAQHLVVLLKVHEEAPTGRGRFQQREEEGVEARCQTKQTVKQHHRAIAPSIAQELDRFSSHRTATIPARLAEEDREPNSPR